MCEFLDLRGLDYREHPEAEAEFLTKLWKLRSTEPRKTTLPSRSAGQARAHIRERDGRADLKWPGGRAGS
jgi:hypothetical protein